ncbi:MAG: lactonase family protein [Armatimonadetes bacterium]|nr:lactonase family protein [Armatimonadota bacterium]
MKRLLLGLVLLLVVGAMTDSTAQPTGDDRSLVFVSSFAGGTEGAINAFELDPASGKLTLVHRTAGVENPFFLALSPARKFLYSIQARQFGSTEHEFVGAYEIVGRNGELKFLNRQSSRGTASCYLDVDATGRSLLVANYTTGSVASLPIQKDGKLDEAASFVQHAGSSVDPGRQTGPHAHCFVISPDNRHAYAADLGLDQVLCYRLDAGKARLTPTRQGFVRTPSGAGPRHLTFHPNGRWMYVINELANSVTAFEYEARTGFLIERGTIATLPRDFTGKSYCADLKITPNGRFLYGTNRGHDSLAAYRIADDGSLALIEIEPSLGKGPQNLLITPDGNWLLCANMPGNNVAVFRIEPETGRLSPAGTPVEVKSPSCMMRLR